jgi:predicted nucleic acid-binding protein
LTFELLSGIESGQWSAVISTISLMEIAVRPWQLSAGAIAAEYEALLVNLPNLAIVDVTRDVAREAARLRASKGFRPADALVAATALVSESTALVTNDKTFARLRDRIDVVLLDELLVG